MITLYIEAPFGSFRKSFARSYAETYSLPPPATVYGMLLSLVGERFRSRHEGVRIAFAFRTLPHVATTLRKLSRYKYGVPHKQSSLGNAPDYVETLCGIEFLCFVDSDQENLRGDGRRTLVERILEAIQSPEHVSRYGVLCLGLSDDVVNDVRLCKRVEGDWHKLIPRPDGEVDLPVWVDHIGSAGTRWQRYHFEPTAANLDSFPLESDWTRIQVPS